jgi:hypothetical protein
MSEQKVMKATNILKHPVFFVIPVVICLAIYMIFFKSSLATGDLFGTKALAARSAGMLEKKRMEAKASGPGVVIPKTDGKVYVDGKALPDPALKNEGVSVAGTAAKSAVEEADGEAEDDLEGQMRHKRLLAEAGKDEKKFRSKAVVVSGADGLARGYWCEVKEGAGVQVEVDRGKICQDDIRKAMADVEAERLRIRGNGDPKGLEASRIAEGVTQ